MMIDDLNLLSPSKTGGWGTPTLHLSPGAARSRCLRSFEATRRGLAAWDMFGASKEAESVRISYGNEFGYRKFLIGAGNRPIRIGTRYLQVPCSYMKGSHF